MELDRLEYTSNRGKHPNSIKALELARENSIKKRQGGACSQGRRDRCGGAYQHSAWRAMCFRRNQVCIHLSNILPIIDYTPEFDR